MQVTIEQLDRAFKLAWSRETSADPDGWSEDNRAWGQCAVTALVAQDYFGGELLNAIASGPGFSSWRHYWNRLSSGLVVDFTQRQFPLGTDFGQFEVRERAAFLDLTGKPRKGSKAQRYQLLKKTLKLYLSGAR